MSPTAAREVLVIGGTGFLGRRITQEFVRHGDNVLVLSRGKSVPGRLPGTESLQADRRDLAALRSALGDRAFDIVVDNIAFDAEDVTGLLQVLTLRVPGRCARCISSAARARLRQRETPGRTSRARKCDSVDRTAATCGGRRR